MIVNKTSNYGASRYAEEKDNKNDIRQNDTDLTTLFTCLQGRVRFGPGTSGNRGENIDGQFLTITTNAVANTETTFSHSLASVPVGYLVLGQDKAGSLYQLASTGTAWTNSSISLKCSVASVTFNLFLLQ